jgi:hypothetical protein
MHFCTSNSTMRPSLIFCTARPVYRGFFARKAA